ncbi:MAG TPA: biosynthetic-type acetolactate synthase large subunit [Thermoanaerobaculia bacterium]|nr:biosynthetic-type acetolactate synthase large subunit [Thermoanaerobaculia bacterium]
MSSAIRTDASPRPKARAARLFVEELVRQGVTHIFGHPGGAALPLYDALYDTPEIAHLLMRHEQCGAHAAEGYARATGRPGVCLATSGPGATNLITGLADAMMDSTPVVALTAQVPTHLIGRDGFQEADIFGLTQPVTKHNWLVRDPDDLVPNVREAFRVAVAGRPGPVLVDIPRDFLQAEIETPDEPAEPAHRARRAEASALRHAALAISNARRPILYVGGGVISSGASEELRKLAKKARIPVTTTLMGKGAYPESDPQSLGMLGMHGTAYANWALHESDLIIGVGVRFDDRVTLKLATWAPHARVVHIDVDEAEIGKNRKADYPLAGDARTVLHQLMPLVGAPDTTAWWARIEELRAKYPLRYRQGPDVILPQYAIETLWRMTRDRRPIVTTDVGQHQMWAAQYWKCDEPRTFITSGGLGTMGFGLPAALGAQCGMPDRLVININGDGSFQQTMQALVTAVEARLPIKVILLNNANLGMVRQWQELFYGRRFISTALANPDFAKIAEAMGAAAFTVRRPEELEAAYGKALAVADGPALVNVHCDGAENCYPMWPASQSIDAMIPEDPRYADGGEASR